MKRHVLTKPVSENLAYRCWDAMIQRCTNPANPKYAYYGGRGITICSEWRNSFHAFIDDIGPRPSRKHSIDRIDVMRGYEPGNVRWATQFEQMRNCRDTKFICAFGSALTLSEWCRKTGLALETLRKRIVILGWPPEMALTLPSQRGRMRRGKN